MFIKCHPLALSVLTLLAAAALPAQAQSPVSYEVTITNTTYNQRFTPLLLTTHKPAVSVFKLGEAASPELRTLAEDGNVTPLKTRLDALPAVTATVAGDALLEPGKTVTFVIQGIPGRDRLSLAGMLIPTNDGFVGLSAVALPMPGGNPLRMSAPGYDAGTEVNDELCASIPGPLFSECGGPGGGAQVGGGEGFVHVHRGMHGVGSFPAAARDWRNPVAQISIRPLR